MVLCAISQSALSFIAASRSFFVTVQPDSFCALNQVLILILIIESVIRLAFSLSSLGMGVITAFKNKLKLVDSSGLENNDAIFEGLQRLEVGQRALDKKVDLQTRIGMRSISWSKSEASFDHEPKH